jgi:hypothetical protein
MNLAGMIGNVLTGLDTALSQPEFTRANPQWQQLYALRNRLDDQQRELVTLSVDPNDQSYKSATEQISAANTRAAAIDNSRIADAIQTAAEVTASMDLFLLGYREPRPDDKSRRDTRVR